jgi:hypothetical protein
MRAQAARNVKSNEAVVRANMLEAVNIAEKIAPYRHHRLAAIELNKDPVDLASTERMSLQELEAEMKKHWERLAPVLDLKALAALSDGVANGEVGNGAGGRMTSGQRRASQPIVMKPAR